jgi:hypothetical protein
LTRNPVSTDNGLPVEGKAERKPSLLWKVTDLSDGVAPVSVVCSARSEADGKPNWSTNLGPAAKEASVMLANYYAGKPPIGVAFS